MSKFTAGIIVIGDEVLSGRTNDKNSSFISKYLIKFGIKLLEIRVISDNSKEIIRCSKEFSKKYSYVFTTGGIGPTHDDITSKSISLAFKKKYIIHKEAYKILEDYYPKGELNEGRIKMAKVPQGCRLIYNPITAAPGFKIKNVYVLPGVPKIMQKMFLSLKKDLIKGNAKKIITIKTNLFESIMAKKLTNIQKKYKDCEIGSYPYFNFSTKKGGVNIVISSWTRKDLKIIIKQITGMISLLGGKSSIV